MSSPTSRLGLVKPDAGDPVSLLRTAISDNADAVDDAIFGLDGIGAAFGSFLAYRSVPQPGLASGGIVIFDTEIRDPDGCYNPATGLWTAPAKGRYRLTATVGSVNNGLTGEWWVASIYSGPASNVLVADGTVGLGATGSAARGISHVDTHVVADAGEEFAILRFTTFTSANIYGSNFSTSFCGELIELLS